MKPLVSTDLRAAIASKLTVDIAYSLGSFGILAVCGILINVGIGGLRNAEALGVFNQAYAVYIVASQLAAWGLHYSVLRNAAFFDGDAPEQGRLLCTAGVMALAFGIAAAVALALLSGMAGDLLRSASTGDSVRIAASGLALFPLNKVLLAYLNAHRHMKAYSVLQSVRYVVILLFVVTIAASTHPIAEASFGFLLAESITAILAVVYLSSVHLVGPLAFDLSWGARHMQFGAKGLLAGMFAEVNSRVDVLMIGFFLPDRSVGIYSFAAMLVDGIYQVLAVVRVNFNPLIVRFLRDADWVQGRRLLRQSKLYLPPLMAGGAAVVLGAFCFLVAVVLPHSGFDEGFWPLAILLIGLLCVSPFIPFDNLMMASGHPGLQTLQQLAVVVANVALIYLLLPRLGLEGVALATSASYLAGVLMLLFLARRVTRWNLITNTIEG